MTARDKKQAANSSIPQRNSCKRGLKKSAFTGLHEPSLSFNLDEATGNGEKGTGYKLDYTSQVAAKQRGLMEGSVNGNRRAITHCLDLDEYNRQHALGKKQPLLSAKDR